MMIYICTPVESRDRDAGQVRERVAELTRRLNLAGYDACSHLDNDCGDKKWADKVAGDIALILASDGMLLDIGWKASRVCTIAETVGKLMFSWRSYVFLHTAEEFEGLKRFII